MSKRRVKNRKLLTEINVIPYVDVSLVLLVIFMVATPFMIQGIDLDLPKTESEALNKSKGDNMTISISKEGYYSMDLGEQEKFYESFEVITKQIEKIIKQQMPIEEKCMLSDFVIETYNKKDTEKQVVSIIKEIEKYLYA